MTAPRPTTWTCLRGFMLAGFAALCFTLLTPPTADAGSRYAIGDPVAFDMKTTTRENFSLEDLRGRLVVVDFWATWHPPCIEMIPHLKRMNQQYNDQGVVMISVSVDDDTKAARRMIRDKDMDWVMVMNNDQDTKPNAQFFASSFGIPHAFLIAPDGNLIWNGHPARLEAQILAALKTHPPGDQGNAMTDALTGEGLADIIVPDHVAKHAAEAVFGDAPDFGELFKQAVLLPAEAYDQAKVKAFGRSVQRSLGKLNPEQQEVYDLYRTTHPDTAAALDAWLAASERSISSANGRSTANPAVVANKFKQAEAAEADGDDLAAYELYRWIVDRAPNSDEAMLAQDVVLVLENDPDFMAQVATQKIEDKAQNILAMAQNFTAAGHDEKAEQLYKKVIAEYPDTDAAKDAATALN